MIGAIVFFGFVFLIILISIKIYISYKFEQIAFEKGYDNTSHSFAMCFWLGIIGYLYVIALPDRGYARNSVITDDKIKQTDNITHTVKDDDSAYDKLIKKAEKYKDTFYDRDYRIHIYESIVNEMRAFANDGHADSVEKLREYTEYLELLKSKRIR